MTDANRCVHGVNPATMCENCSRYYTSDAAAVEALTIPYELAKPDPQQPSARTTEGRCPRCFAAPGQLCIVGCSNSHPDAPGQRQPSTPELIATVRAGLAHNKVLSQVALLNHVDVDKACEALTELEKRIGGERWLR